MKFTDLIKNVTKSIKREINQYRLDRAKAFIENQNKKETEK